MYECSVIFCICILLRFKNYVYFITQLNFVT